MVINNSAAGEQPCAEFGFLHRAGTEAGLCAQLKCSWLGASLHSSKQPNSLIMTPFFVILLVSLCQVIPQIFCSWYTEVLDMLKYLSELHSWFALWPPAPQKAAETGAVFYCCRTPGLRMPVRTTHPELSVDGRGWGKEQNSVCAGATAPLALRKAPGTFSSSCDSLPELLQPTNCFIMLL